PMRSARNVSRVMRRTLGFGASRRAQANAECRMQNAETMRQNFLHSAFNILHSRYSGIFPCFFGGFLSRLFLDMANAVISFRRVKRGSMISSIYPRSAAM